jgi:hypothetical protein
VRVWHLPATTMLRALGEFTGRPGGTHLLTGFEARLNERAAARLEEYTGRPGDLLARVLPGLRGGGDRGPALPPGRPALCFYVTPARLPCQLAASGPSGPDALVMPGWTPLVCRRHRPIRRAVILRDKHTPLQIIRSIADNQIVFV